MSDRLERLVGFGRYLRSQGLPVGTGRILMFCRAAAALQPVGVGDLYWAGRATLVSNKQDAEAFDRAFASYFGSTASSVEDRDAQTAPSSKVDEETEPPPEELEFLPAAWTLPDDDEEVEGEVAVGITASSTEVLRHKSFDELTDEENKQAQLLIRRLKLGLPERRGRRRRAAPKGRDFDLRRTLRYSLRTQGEPFRRARRNRRTKLRPLVLVLDVSGSMSPYSRALLQFGFAAMAAGHKVEVFCFGTRLTRVTRVLRRRDPNRAFKEVADLVSDWDGGTRIGDSLRELMNRYGQHGFLRGSVVVLCSDGLERGDPDVLAAEMRRLSRFAHRLVWVNPLKGSPAYEPLARGMAAALPHVDVFLPGHNIASLEALGDVLSN